MLWYNNACLRRRNMARLYNLTGNNIKGTPIVRRPDWDFEDDGSNFRCFEYRGLRISVTTWDGELFLAIREEGLAQFPSHDWFDTEEYKLTNKYNGIRDGFDLDELFSDCDKIIAKIEELNKAFKEEVIDWRPVYAKIEEEILQASTLAEKYKTIKWWNIPEKSWDFREYTDYFRSFMRQIESAQKTLVAISSQTIEKRRLKEHVYSLKNYGYVCMKVNKDDFYIKHLDELLAKYN